MSKSRTSTGVTCTTCGMQISRKADLKRHMKTHSLNKEELMHLCPFEGCDHKTLQKSNLVIHMNTHTGERPYKCLVRGCKFRSSDPGSLTRHRKDMHSHVTRRSKKKKSDANEALVSSSMSGDSISQADLTLDVYRTPRPELLEIQDFNASLVAPKDCCANYSSKNSSAGFNAHVVTKEHELNHQHPALHTEAFSSFSLNSGLLMAPDVPIADYTQAPASEQWNLQTVELPVQLAAEIASVDISKDILSHFLTDFDYFQALIDASPLTPTSAAIYDLSVPYLPPLSNVLDPYCAVNDAPIPSISQTVEDHPPSLSLSSESVHTVNNAGDERCGYGANVVPLDTRPFEDYLSAGYPQITGRSYLYTAPVWLDGHPKQDVTCPNVESMLLLNS